jgi:hypothetical protein
MFVTLCTDFFLIIRHHFFSSYQILGNNSLQYPLGGSFVGRDYFVVYGTLKSFLSTVTYFLAHLPELFPYFLLFVAPGIVLYCLPTRGL